MAISVVEAERMSQPEIEQEVAQLEKLIDYHIRKYYPGPIPLIKFRRPHQSAKVLQRIREIYMAGGWIINIVSSEDDGKGRKCIHIVNPERPY